MFGFGRPRQCKKEKGVGLQILDNFIKPQLSHNLLNPSYVLVAVFLIWINGFNKIFMGGA
jgi:hypothetical protein